MVVKPKLIITHLNLHSQNVCQLIRAAKAVLDSCECVIWVVYEESLRELLKNRSITRMYKVDEERVTQLVIVDPCKLTKLEVTEGAF